MNCQLKRSNKIISIKCNTKLEKQRSEGIALKCFPDDVLLRSEHAMGITVTQESENEFPHYSTRSMVTTSRLPLRIKPPTGARAY
jgi:hypothetical protein